MSTAAQRLADGLSKDGHAHVDAASMRRALRLDAADVARFAAHWDELTLDRHMADGGTYRRRRYAALTLRSPDAVPVRLPHGPYRQEAIDNPLNGGLDRHFDPVTDAMFESPALGRFLALVARALDTVEGRSAPWRVRLHPYRILAAADAPGEPSPEGPHRDGVDFVMSWMIGRSGVTGGESSVLDAAGSALWRRTLREPLELSIVDDRRVRHDVTGIRANADAGRRDVFVIAFDRPEPT